MPSYQLSVRIMKNHAVHIIVIAAILGISVAYRLQHAAPAESAFTVTGLQVQADSPKAIDSGLARDELVVPEPAPEPEQRVITPPVKAAVPTAGIPPETASKHEQELMAYWQHMKEIFNRQMEQLDREMDPARRLQLIRAMARYVRADTFSALDWAMRLEEPEEKRAALEAINKTALTGIGAMIEIDETGFPKIKKTTVLSAIAATGMVEPGDYIVGMMDGDGQLIYFNDLPAGQITQHLRGLPGTEIRVLLERVPSDGGTPYGFDVPVQRSLIVMQPPF